MSRKTNPLISVIMSVYNSEKYLSESIESILNQTYTNFEFIIINDASTDSSSAILDYYERKDSRIKIIRNEKNIGLTKSLNKGIAISKGKYIARMDADDVSLPRRLELQLSRLQDSQADICFCRAYFIYQDSGEKRIWKENHWDLIRWFSMFSNQFGLHSSAFYIKNMILSIGGYDEDFFYAQDYELWERSLHNKLKFVYEKEILINYFYRNNGISIDHRIEQEFFSTLVKKRAIMRNLSGLDEEEVQGLIWIFSHKSDPIPKVELIHSIKKINILIKEFFKKNNIENKYIIWNAVSMSLESTIKKNIQKSVIINLFPIFLKASLFSSSPKRMVLALFTFISISSKKILNV